MAKMEFKEFDAMSVAKIQGIFGVILGFVMGVFFAAFGGSPWGRGAIIMMPFAYGLLCFVGGAFFALIYNWVAKKIGGVKVRT